MLSTLEETCPCLEDSDVRIVDSDLDLKLAITGLDARLMHGLGDTVARNSAGTLYCK